MRKNLNTIIKTFVLMIMMLLCVNASNVANAADNDISIYINGEKVETEVAPISIYGRTMIPLRAVLEKLGAKVDWNSNTKTATATTDEYKVSVKLNSDVITTNFLEEGLTREEKMDTAPEIRNARLLIPVRFIAEALGKEVNWDNFYRAVVIEDNAAYEKRAANQLAVFYKIAKEYENETSLGGEYSHEFVISRDGIERVTVITSGKVYSKSQNKAYGTITVKVDGSKENIEKEIVGKKEKIDTFKDKTIEFWIENDTLYLKSKELCDMIKTSNPALSFDSQNGIYLNNINYKVLLQNILPLYYKVGFSNAHDYIESVHDSVTQYDNYELSNLEKSIIKRNLINRIIYLNENDAFTKTNNGYVYKYDNDRLVNAYKRLIDDEGLFDISESDYRFVMKYYNLEYVEPFTSIMNENKKVEFVLGENKNIKTEKITKAINPPSSEYVERKIYSNYDYDIDIPTLSTVEKAKMTDMNEESDYIYLTLQVLFEALEITD